MITSNFWKTKNLKSCTINSYWKKLSNSAGKIKLHIYSKILKLKMMNLKNFIKKWIHTSNINSRKLERTWFSIDWRWYLKWVFWVHLRILFVFLKELRFKSNYSCLNWSKEERLWFQISCRKRICLRALDFMIRLSKLCSQWSPETKRNSWICKWIWWSILTNNTLFSVCWVWEQRLIKIKRKA